MSWDTSPREQELLCTVITVQPWGTWRSWSWGTELSTRSVLQRAPYLYCGHVSPTRRTHLHGLPVRKTYGGSKYRCRCRLLPSPSLYPQSKCKYIAGWTWCLLNVFSTSSRADPLCPSPDSCYSSQFSPIVRVFFLSQGQMTLGKCESQGPPKLA